MSDSRRGIIRVAHHQGRWEAIPRALIEDARLSIEARWFAIWLTARPTGWEIRAGALPRLLVDRTRCSGHLGRDASKQLLRELETAGYLVRRRRRGARGRWVWESSFDPARTSTSIDCLTIDGTSGDGQTVAGQGVDLLQTGCTPRQNNLKLKPTTDRSEVSESAAEKSSTSTVLTFPEPLSGATLLDARKLLEQCPMGQRQAILDEVGLTHSKGLLRNPMGFLYRLVQRARAGEFHPSRTSGSPGATRRRRPNGELSTSTSDVVPLEAAAIAARVIAKFRDAQ
jgi:hypothetical protein